MKLSEILRVAVERGIEADPRGREGVGRLLARERDAYDKLDEADRPYHDAERLTNPYADTRVNAGDPELEVRGMLAGIDMEVGEVLLADRMRSNGEPVDLILSHHPEGQGYARLDLVMGMQADLWHRQGVGLGAADALIAPRAAEVRRKIMPANHYRAVAAAEILGIAMMSCHTPADNCVAAFVQAHLDRESPGTLDGLVKALRAIPEYADAARKGYGPVLIQGSGDARPGKVVVDMTGGTEGPEEALARLSSAGVDTLVGMHYSEEHRKRAEELKLNLVIAGHVSSDTIGMNLVIDAVQAAGDVAVTCTSGMIRVTR